MLLLVFAGLGVLVIDNEVDFVSGTTLIGSEHDNVGRCVGEFILVKSLVIAEELHISTTTFKTIYMRVSEM